MISAAALAAMLGGFRWLRVAQREHYLPGSCLRTGRRWWGLAENLALAGVMIVLAGVGLVTANLAATGLAVGLAVIGPVGLGLRGRTSSLAWTWRLARLAAASLVILAAAGWLLWRVDGDLFGWILPLAGPAIVDLALGLLRPLEEHLGTTWVRQATVRLARSGARTVAITGSYGKTSTKVVLTHLLSGVAPTVASPASFNNRLGLARAINEHVGSGTEIFVAEMGTYGPGEIRRLCEWIPPEVAVITAIGPVHLERMKSLATIAAAKREILERAVVGVINIDDPLLADIAAEEKGRIRIVTVSTSDRSADVHVDPATGEVSVAGVSLGSHGGRDILAATLAAALGAVLALGFDVSRVFDRVATAPVAPHRASRSMGSTGVSIIDDTFNSNPAGAGAALELLAAEGSGRKVLVTPGMVELGTIQFEENRRLARQAADLVTDLVVVGRTNRKALMIGATEGGIASVIVVPDRPAAVEWVREHLGSGDAVLYENDLPDHYA